MTRKRYIKLLQGCGCERNTANAMADLVRYLGRRYAEAVHGDMQYCTFIAKGLGLTIRRGLYNPKVWAAVARTNMPLYWRYPRIVAVDTGREVEIANNPSRDGYSARAHIVDELPPLNPDVRMDGTTQRIILHPSQPPHGGGGI